LLNKININLKNTVLVAMSGGVDSSTTAALLKRQGYSVIGITMRLTDAEDGDVYSDRSCCSVEMASRARRVCDMLGIPHYVVDFRGAFQKEVKDNFYEQYLIGKTPNPCVRCNTYIKWKPLVQKKNSLSVEFIATGHYARCLKNNETGHYELHRGKDYWKDQSYFLWGLTAEQLSYTLFPLGELTKKEVREIAHTLELPTADVKESYEICFISDNNYRRYVGHRMLIEQRLPSSGNILTGTGEFIAAHTGIHQFTIGQRHKLGIAVGKPVYVTEINPITNTVVIGNYDDLLSNSLIAESVNWINGIPGEPEFEATVKVRYRDPGHPARLKPLGEDRVAVYFSESARSVTPGQSAVFYSGDRLLGGGVITKKNV